MTNSTRPVVYYLIFFSVVNGILGVISVAIGAFFSASFSMNLTIPIAAAVWGSTVAFPIGNWVAEATGRSFLKSAGALALGAVSLLVCTTSMGWLGLYLFTQAAEWIGWGVATATAGLMTWSVLNALLPQTITTIRQQGPVSMRIVQLTDIHLDGITPTWWVRRLVETVKTLNPDLIVFTGDLLDISPSHVAHQLQLLKTLPTRLGKYAVSGNHDFYLGYPAYQSILSEIGFTLLDNKTVMLKGITLVGVPDPDAKRFGFETAKLPVIDPATNENAPVLFLSHRPDPFPQMAARSKVLQLSGHTHWGQIPPFGVITRLWHQFSRGYRTLNASAIYISKGTGVWGPPMRLFGRSEIVVIDISNPT